MENGITETGSYCELETAKLLGQCVPLTSLDPCSESG